MQTTNSVQSFKKIHHTVGKELHDDPVFFLKGVIIGCIISLFLWVIIFRIIIWLLTRIGFGQFDEAQT